MNYSLTWLLPVLRDAGVKVAPDPGWESRACRPGASGEMGAIQGVICHHTATVRGGNMPSLGTLRGGKPGVPGPLAQLGLGRDGTFYLIAAGRANHAGPGQGKYETVSGNSHYVGIEAENPLPYTASWPEVQLDAYHRGVAAILKHVGAPVERCIAHKEYAPRRKPTDPALNMDMFRAAVKAVMEGGTVRPLIPAVSGGRHTLRRVGDPAMVNDEVRQLQALLGFAAPSGNFDGATEAAVRAFQRRVGLVADGIVGPKTWKAIDGT